MPHPMTLPLIAGLTVAGAALGVHFGRTAIAEINPAYFTDPEPAFHADLVPYRSSDWAQVQAAEYQRAYEGLGSGCVGCRDYPVEYLPETHYGVEIWGEGEPAEIAWAGGEDDVDAPREIEPDPARERVERYASYPIEAEAAESDSPDEEVAEPIGL